MSDDLTPSTSANASDANFPASAPPAGGNDEEDWIGDIPGGVAAAPTQKSPTQNPTAAQGPVALVETAFLASAASLMWLINLYFPPGPLLRILFPIPIALVYLRRHPRAAWMATLVSGLLLAILIGPPRGLLYVMPYGVLGVQLGCHWRRGNSWLLSIPLGALLVTLGMFFRIWLLSWMAGEDLWGYLVAQITQILDWLTSRLLDFGLVGLGAIGQPNMAVIQIGAIAMLFFSSVVYLFTVHIAAWLVLERLGVRMSPPPRWVQSLLDA